MNIFQLSPDGGLDVMMRFSGKFVREAAQYPGAAEEKAWIKKWKKYTDHTSTPNNYHMEPLVVNGYGNLHPSVVTIVRDCNCNAAMHSFSGTWDNSIFMTVDKIT